MSTGPLSVSHEATLPLTARLWLSEVFIWTRRAGLGHKHSGLAFGEES